MILALFDQTVTYEGGGGSSGHDVWLAGLLALIVALAAQLFAHNRARKRERRKEFDDALDRLAAAGIGVRKWTTITAAQIEQYRHGAESPQDAIVAFSGARHEWIAAGESLTRRFPRLSEVAHAIAQSDRELPELGTWVDAPGAKAAAAKLRSGLADWDELREFAVAVAAEHRPR